jgi:MFS family permease
MIYVLRVIGSIIAGFALALVLVIALELFSNVVHPLPADFAGTADEMCRHVERYPGWVLVVAAVAWTATAFVSTWLATRLGGKIPGILLSLFLVWAVVFNVAMLPYPVWFKAVSVLGIVAACLAGIGLPGRRVTLQPS